MKTGTKIVAGSIAAVSIAGLNVLYDVNYGTKRNIRYIEKKIKHVPLYAVFCIRE